MEVYLHFPTLHGFIIKHRNKFTFPQSSMKNSALTPPCPTASLRSTLHRNKPIDLRRRCQINSESCVTGVAVRRISGRRSCDVGGPAESLLTPAQQRPLPLQHDTIPSRHSQFDPKLLRRFREALPGATAVLRDATPCWSQRTPIYRLHLQGLGVRQAREQQKQAAGIADS